MKFYSKVLVWMKFQMLRFFTNTKKKINFLNGICIVLLRVTLTHCPFKGGIMLRGEVDNKHCYGLFTRDKSHRLVEVYFGERYIHFNNKFT